eukprot:snap_masked-scaffold_4-processed-gene-1.3-mRNA-1 protein AED:0.05 eAED:0.05 QI:0/-1/0/1/-1/1/1/0/212
MGISRAGRYKRRHTGGKRKINIKKRKYELGRQPAMTKLGGRKVTKVRCMGGNLKWRALRLETGNFSWGTQVCTRKTKILDVSYNSTNNELLRTKTLVKGCIVQIDGTPFKQWFESHYGEKLGKKKLAKLQAQGKVEESSDLPAEYKKKQAERAEGLKKDGGVDQKLDDLFSTGRLYAKITSRPGQCGKADGYILEGQELEFYQKMMSKKKSK